MTSPLCRPRVLPGLFRWPSCPWLLGCLLALTVGCGGGSGKTASPAVGQGSADHDHAGDHDHDHDHAHDHDHDHAGEHGDEHRHPTTLAGGLSELEAVIAKVKASLTDGDASGADGHVHAVGHLLEDLGGIAATLDEEVREKVAGSVDELMDAFTELDEKIHDGGKPVFDDIAERVEKALAGLRSHVAELGAAVEGESASRDAEAAGEK
jgi:hypothetical protein